MTIMSIVDKAADIIRRYTEDTLFTALYESAIDDYAGFGLAYYPDGADDELKADIDRQFANSDIDFVIEDLFHGDLNNLAPFTTSFINRHYRFLNRR